MVWALVYGFGSLGVMRFRFISVASACFAPGASVLVFQVLWGGVMALCWQLALGASDAPDRDAVG